MRLFILRIKYSLELIISFPSHLFSIFVFLNEISVKVPLMLDLLFKKKFLEFPIEFLNC